MRGAMSRTGALPRVRRPRRRRARFCALVSDTSTPSPAQRPHHIMPRARAAAPASACASSASGDTADARQADIARVGGERARAKRGARARRAGRAARERTRERRRSERRCASAMSACDRARVTEHSSLVKCSSLVSSYALVHDRRWRFGERGRPTAATVRGARSSSRWVRRRSLYKAGARVGASRTRSIRLRAVYAPSTRASSIRARSCAPPPRSLVTGTHEGSVSRQCWCPVCSIQPPPPPPLAAVASGSVLGRALVGPSVREAPCV